MYFLFFFIYCSIKCVFYIVLWIKGLPNHPAKWHRPSHCCYISNLYSDFPSVFCSFPIIQMSNLNYELTNWVFANKGHRTSVALSFCSITALHFQCKHAQVFSRIFTSTRTSWKIPHLPLNCSHSPWSLGCSPRISSSMKASVNTNQNRHVLVTSRVSMTSDPKEMWLLCFKFSFWEPVGSFKIAYEGTTFLSKTCP